MTDSQVKQRVTESYLNDFPEDAARLLESLLPGERLEYMEKLAPGTAGRVLSRMIPDDASLILEHMNEHGYKELVEHLDVFLASRLISRFPSERMASRLELLPAFRAKQIRELIHYPANCAAHIMDPAVTAFRENTTVKEALKKLRTLKDRNLYQVFLLDDEGRLTHSLPVQTLAVSEPKELLGDLTDAPPISISALSPMEEVVALLNEKRLINLPVVDVNMRLLGVIRNNELINAAREDITQNVQALFGAGREEMAMSKVSFAVRKRLPWLQINLATAFLAASVVAIFEDTISRITVLAVFLPVVAGQSGNTGSQALAVTMRGLALREINVSQWFTVARKEILVGLINGVAVALTTSLIVYLWASSLGLAIVIAISMILSMAIAGLSGALIPMLLKSLGQDPASSSSIILTTVTDIVGFFSFLGLATALATALEIV